MAIADQTSQTANSSTQGFDQLAVGLQGAVKEFQNNQPESFDAILAMIRPIGDYSMNALRTTASYARRHPVRVAFTVAAIGFVASRLMNMKSEDAKALR